MIDRPEPSLGGGFVASEPSAGGNRGVNLRLDLSYDGAAFHGFAENAGVRTVGGDLRAALEQVLRQPLTLAVAGRTDTGVHALGQVVNVFVDRSAGTTDLVRLRSSLNSMLAPSIAVSGIREVDQGFSARFSAQFRTYRYLVLNSPVPDPFFATRAWWVEAPLDIEAMNDAAAHLLGEHDFSCFCRRPNDGREHSLVRRVTSAGWSVRPEPEGLLRFEVSASAFCHQMVRSIVGALVSVGRGRRRSDEVPVMIGSRSRNGMPVLAPPHGLYLYEVGYGNDGKSL